MDELKELNAIAINIKSPSPGDLFSREFWLAELERMLHQVNVDYFAEKSVSIFTHNKAVFVVAAEDLDDLLPRVCDSYGRDTQSLIVVVSGLKGNKQLAVRNNSILSRKNIPLIELKTPDIINEYGKSLKLNFLKGDIDPDNPLYRFLGNLAQEVLLALIIKFFLS